MVTSVLLLRSEHAPGTRNVTTHPACPPPAPASALRRSWAGGAALAVVLLTVAITSQVLGQDSTAAGGTGRVRLTLAPDGNQARYRVREQLAGVDFPNDAVGVTTGLTGAMVLDATGEPVPALSRFTADVTTLESDRERRDRYVTRRTLATDSFPTVQFVPTALRGLPLPLPTEGTLTFELVGDLTIKQVTRPVTWQVTATAAADGFTGTASTAFTFADFGLTRPRVAAVLSVDETIRLEYDFRLLYEAPARE